MLVNSTDNRPVIKLVIVGIALISVAAVGSFSVANSGQPNAHRSVATAQ